MPQKVYFTCLMFHMGHQAAEDYQGIFWIIRSLWKEEHQVLIGSGVQFGPVPPPQGEDNSSRISPSGQLCPDAAVCS